MIQIFLEMLHGQRKIRLLSLDMDQLSMVEIHGIGTGMTGEGTKIMTRMRWSGLGMVL